MKRKLLIFILVAALLGGAVSVVYVNIVDRLPGRTAGDSSTEELTKSQREKLIAENTDKYQPKGDTTNSTGPSVSAKAAIVVDENTNQILFAKNIHEPLPPASVIKVLTLSVALDIFKGDDLIEITQRASEQISNKINMKPGERLRVSDLLYGLMMISANDAAYAIADATNGGFDQFIKLANERVELLGLKETTMKNPAGLDEEGQISSAYDLATLTRYALLEHPEFIDYAGKTKEHSVYATEHNEPHWWFGHLSHMLTAYKPMIAAKTGYTDEAGTTYIGVAQKDGRRLVVVILGAKGANANTDVKNLLDYGFSK